MKTVNSIDAMRSLHQQWRQAGLTIALVPTMGNLHAGHISLVKKALSLADKVVVSVFVNPTQFDIEADLLAYPRTLDTDIERLADVDIAAVFAPSVTEMYPNGYRALTQVTVPGLSDMHDGASRPGHFNGVTTVVSKLLNIVQPDHAVFGQKDFQQLLIVKKMAQDLNSNTDIVALPTVRDDDGLALSSRNGYLTEKERLVAPELQRVLVELASAISGEYAEIVVKSCENATKTLESLGFKPDYIKVCHSQTLSEDIQLGDPLVILAAAWLGKARLIDNIVL